MNTICSYDVLLKDSKIPFGLIIQPFADAGEGEKPCPIVHFKGNDPVRCERCKCYVNPHFQWLDEGNSFKCNFCGHTGKVPEFYFSKCDMDGIR